MTTFLCGTAFDAPTALRLLVLAPLLEESTVRAGVQHWLLRRGWRAAPAVVLCGVAFSLLHAGSGPVAVAAVFVPGLMLGMTYQRWRDWRLCAALHSLMNGFLMIVCRFVDL